MPALAANPLKLQRLLHALFQQQARDALRRISLSSLEVPDLAHWNEVMAEAVKPLLLQHFQAGILRSRRRLSELLAGRKPVEPRRVLLHPEHTFDEHGKGVMPYAGDRTLRSASASYLQVNWAAPVVEGGPAILPLSAGNPARPFYKALGGSLQGTLQQSVDIVTRGQRFTRPASFYPYRRKAANIGMDFDLFSPRVLDAVDAAAFKFCRETNATATSDLKTALAKLRKLMKRGLERGDAISHLARQVRRIFADQSRAFRIAATETGRAMHEGALMNAKESGVKKKQWLASADACDTGGPNNKGCLGLDGKQVALDKPFWVDPAGGPYSVVMAPPLHPHCLLPVTPIRAPEIVSAFKAFFAGTCYRITFANGDEVACTPNHMLLTPHGLLRAADFMEGDHVLYCPLGQGPGWANPYDNGEPATIEKVFDALAVASCLPAGRVEVSAEYLHGDAAFCQGKIDVVEADGFLGDDRNSGDRLFKPVQESGFQDGEFTLTFDGCSQTELGRQLHGLAALCSVGSRRHKDAVLLAKDRKRFGVFSCDHSSPFKRSQNRMATATVLIGQGVSRSARSVLPDDLLDLSGVETLAVRHVRSFRYRGWVYDLQTASTLYSISSGIVGSNCFCDFTEVLTDDIIEAVPLEGRLSGRLR